jgi:hypothetical protein
MVSEVIQCHKIHRQIIATGNEWKPCVECGGKFDLGEVMTAIDTGSNAGVVHWFCDECTDRLYGFLLAHSWRQTWVLRRGDGGIGHIDLDAARYGDAG